VSNHEAFKYLADIAREGNTTYSTALHVLKVIILSAVLATKFGISFGLDVYTFLRKPEVLFGGH